MAIVIRPAVAADAAPLVSVRSQAEAGRPAQPLHPPPAARDAAYFSRLIADHPGLVLVAAAPAGPIAYLALARAAHPAVTAHRPMQLWQLYVAAASQGRGVGGQLLSAARGYAQRHQHDVLWLGVAEHNTRAVAFYRRHGFVSLGLHRLARGEHAHQDLLMSCQL